MDEPVAGRELTLELRTSADRQIHRHWRVRRLVDRKTILVSHVRRLEHDQEIGVRIGIALAARERPEQADLDDLSVLGAEARRERAERGKNRVPIE